MQFASIATTAAALVALPLTISATAPQMSGVEFISAVRCTAYTNAARPDAALSEIKWRLNSEARRQSAERAAAARLAASAAAQLAASGEGAEIAANCGAFIANGAIGARAV